MHSKRPTFSPLPLEGAVERSETGLAPPICWKCVSSVSLSPPLSGIAFYKNQREASLRLSLPLEGKADDTG